MSKRRTGILALALAALLAIGLLAGLSTESAFGIDPTSTTTTTEPTSTTAPTTTTDPTTTAVTTTDPVTTTAPTTTTAPDPPPPTTTTVPAPTTTAANVTTLPAQVTTQEAVNPPPASTVTVTTQVTTTVPAPTTTTSTVPVAPCDTTQLTCGNNASTQVALVSQTCSASSANTTLNVTVQTIAGDPVNNVTITPQTSCLNIAAITQIVEQYCVGCTVIVIPPPPPVIYVPVPGTDTVTNNTTTVVQTPKGPSTTRADQPPIRVEAYCLPQPVIQNGVPKTLLYLPIGTPQHDKTYALAFPATFVPGIGMKCPSTKGAALVASVPMFTLTVPASFVGQSLRLCLQGSHGKAFCHTVRIARGATVAVPVTSNIVASVVKSKVQKRATGKQITNATGALAALGKAK